MASSSKHFSSMHATLPPPSIAVVAVPLPAQGHLNQLLHLSRLISAYSIPVHYVGTPSGNNQANLRFHGCHPSTISNIHFHDFPIPTSQRPNNHPTSSTTDFPFHLQHSLFQAASHLLLPVTSLVHNLVSTKKFKRIIIIHDSLMGSVVQDIVSLPNIEAYTFHSVSAFTIFFFLWEKLERPFSVDKKMLQHLPSLEGCFTPEFLNFITQQHNYIQSNYCGRIYNTCRIVEGTFLDFLSRNEISNGKKQFALGPFNPVVITHKKEDSKCLKFLDKHPQNSVIFISFGTTISLSGHQIVELAKGLERSNERFLWVLREADNKGDFFDDQSKREVIITEYIKDTNYNIRSVLQLPKGFEERVRGRGLVVRGWVPQLDILAHPATGGFLSHCGWNSCMESISFGVPMGTWPMHSDQPRNAVLVVKFLEVGIVVREWERRHEIVTASEIVGAVKALMASEEGGRLRKRAEDLGGAVCRSVLEEGGDVRMEWDAFVAHITR